MTIINNKNKLYSNISDILCLLTSGQWIIKPMCGYDSFSKLISTQKIFPIKFFPKNIFTI